MEHIILPKTECLFLKEQDCPTCGKYVRPTIEVSDQFQWKGELLWIAAMDRFQEAHDRKRQEEFDRLELVPIPPRYSFRNGEEPEWIMSIPIVKR